MSICAIGATEMILICAVILLIFGGKKLPELMRGMGKGVKSFKEGMNELSEEELDRRVDEEIRRRADIREAEGRGCGPDEESGPVSSGTKSAGSEREGR